MEYYSYLTNSGEVDRLRYPRGLRMYLNSSTLKRDRVYNSYKDNNLGGTVYCGAKSEKDGTTEESSSVGWS